MTQYSWKTCPEPVRRQVAEFVRSLQAVLDDNLIGIYLHGSLSMGCFNPDRSDLDLLVITQEQMLIEIKHRCIERLLRSSAAPIPIEISFLARGDLHPWRYPTTFDLHYSEEWRERYERDLASGTWTRWNEQPRTDLDLAAHITHLQDRGVVLRGPPIGDVFPEVPHADYVDSILSDYEYARARIIQNPVYAVLNMCRVYRYLMDGTLSSKDEAGEWARAVLPEEARAAVEAALAHYRGHAADEVLSPGSLATLTSSVEKSVQVLLEKRPG